MNMQEIFDKVAQHLLTQPRSTKIVNGYPKCMYRGDNGTKCAAGCLIPDDEYKSWMEGSGIYGIYHKIPSLAKISGVTLSMIMDLQSIHDTGTFTDTTIIPQDRKYLDEEKTRQQLKKLAEKYGISANILNTIPKRTEN